MPVPADCSILLYGTLLLKRSLLTQCDPTLRTLQPQATTVELPATTVELPPSDATRQGKNNHSRRASGTKYEGTIRGTERRY
jgi:hypothetical protein